MTSVPATATCVRLPAGPLLWLFPELQPPNDLVAIDFAAALAGTAPTLLVPLGPLGRTARRALVQRLCGTARQVQFDADRPSFEQRLADAALAAGPGRLLALQADGSPMPCTEDLRTYARSCAAPRLLPLHPGADLEVQLNAALAADLPPGTLVPFFVTDPMPAPPAQATTRLPESWFGLLPGDHHPPATRALTHRLLARLWPDRMPLYAALENCALGGFDLWLEALLGRSLGVAPPPAMRTPLLLGFCGIDGSGKSSHLQALREWLVARGLRVAVQKFYRHGVFHETVTEVARRCAGDRALHLWRFERLAKLMDSRKCLPAIERDLQSHDVVLFDRSIWTHLAAGTGRSHHDPFARELLAGMPVPHCTFLLDVPVEVAAVRLAGRGALTVDENPYMLSRYRALLLELGHRHDFVVLDAEAPFADNQARIRAAVERLLP